MLKPALAIMSRAPSKEGKSRLGAVLSPAQREALQWAFLEDTLDKVSRLTEFERYLAVTPSGDLNKLAKKLEFGGRVMPQSGGNLGQRMHDIAERLFLTGHAPVILIGTDVPALPPSYLQKALYLLEQSDLVFGPALDGGYCLIGMRYFEGRVFDGISWGSEKVLEETLKICEENKLSYGLLECLMDIDRPGDLLALMRQYENKKIDIELIPARTIRFLKSIEIRNLLYEEH
ncbi:2-phospho-L-lactate guanylyltransferase [Pelotomaculum sp. FP]|uniref:TIGR04282 family arsenosugar biosynthesis glycosyltransferase n=1 Tax=Pelotomaculum sp. FP TaxID=261474 RepID=UPI00106534D4|nr:TIGR04282 family arsenosugar biosynthesis glycosyltransferase [Pelotomaculum sp. FP]TEB14645.1 2-phospho-L-lactate guanylyltransferase [Pelotomaculum sp. FP]